jgi:hypothetical protein
LLFPVMIMVIWLSGTSGETDITITLIDSSVSKHPF